MNPPTDRERPALSEAPSIHDEAHLRYDKMTMRNAFIAGAKWARETSPKPALTQGGLAVDHIVASTKGLAHHMDRDGIGWWNVKLTSAHVEELVALERLAGERGGLQGHALGDAIALNLMRWQCDSDDGDWPEDKCRDLLTHHDKQHSGDCTKQPWTCLRCSAETVYLQANELLALVHPLAPQPLPVEVERATCPTCKGRGYVEHEGGDSTMSVAEREWCPRCQGLTAHPAQEWFAENAHQGPASPDAEALAKMVMDMHAEYMRDEECDYVKINYLIEEAAALIRGSGS